MIVYADTSALAKVFLEEDGSAEMREVAGTAERIGSAAIAYVELRAALAAAVRDGRVAASSRSAVILELEQLWTGISEIPLDAQLLRRAGDLAEQMGLRGYDAVHLAALAQSGNPDDVTFACWDNDLRSAARQMGYRLVPA